MGLLNHVPRLLGWECSVTILSRSRIVSSSVMGSSCLLIERTKPLNICAILRCVAFRSVCIIPTGADTERAASSSGWSPEVRLARLLLLQACAREHPLAYSLEMYVRGLTLIRRGPMRRPAVSESFKKSSTASRQDPYLVFSLEAKGVEALWGSDSSPIFTWRKRALTGA